MGCHTLEHVSQPGGNETPPPIGKRGGPLTDLNFGWGVDRAWGPWGWLARALPQAWARAVTRGRKMPPARAATEGMAGARSASLSTSEYVSPRDVLPNSATAGRGPTRGGGPEDRWTATLGEGGGLMCYGLTREHWLS